MHIVCSSRAVDTAHDAGVLCLHSNAYTTAIVGRESQQHLLLHELARSWAYATAVVFFWLHYCGLGRLVTLRCDVNRGTCSRGLYAVDMGRVTPTMLCYVYAHVGECTQCLSGSSKHVLTALQVEHCA